MPFEATKTGWIGNKNRMELTFRQQKQDDRQQKQDGVTLFHLQKKLKKWIGNKNRIELTFRQQKQDDRQQKQDGINFKQQKQDKNTNKNIFS